MNNNDVAIWLKRLLCVDFKGKDIIERQIQGLEFEIKEEYAYISVEFVKNENLESFPSDVRVPLEMRVFQEQAAPIVFLLHIINGYVNELEIITADSSQINISNLKYQKVESVNIIHVIMCLISFLTRGQVLI